MVTNLGCVVAAWALRARREDCQRELGVSVPRTTQVSWSLASSGGVGGRAGRGEDGGPFGGGSLVEAGDFGGVVEGVEVDVGEKDGGDGGLGWCGHSYGAEGEQEGGDELAAHAVIVGQGRCWEA